MKIIFKLLSRPVCTFTPKANDFTRDTTITVFSDFFTAFYAGLVVFTVTGFMAKESGKTVDEMAKVSGMF